MSASTVRIGGVPPTPSRTPIAPMWARLHGITLWFLTGLDDIFVERFWKRLRRGEVVAAFRVFPDVLLGFWGCTAAVLLAVVLAVLAIAAAL